MIFQFQFQHGGLPGNRRQHIPGFIMKIAGQILTHRRQLLRPFLYGPVQKIYPDVLLFPDL
ncbi:hypothetical protein D3C86_2265230 [compost metagenome]